MEEAASRAARMQGNKTLAVDFLGRVFDAGDFDAARLCLADHFVHHEPGVAAGPQGYIAFLAGDIARQGHVTVEPVRVMADGDFVLVHNRRERAGSVTAFIDVMKIQQGRIVDYWQVHQPVPAVIANPNGMF